MKKKKIIEVRECDYCGKEFDGVCELCGKDVCRECSRWICRKKYSPTSGGIPLTFGSNSYDPYPWEWKAELRICEQCAEKFKMSLAILAGKKKGKKT